MPLPRRKGDGSFGAPVLDIMKARVKLFDVEEKTESWTVESQSDGAQFTLDPQFKCSVEVIADYDGGRDNGVKFFESFKYKNRNGEWTNQSNSKLGMLTEVVKPGYFDDESIPALTAEDLEGFELHCRVKPKKNPNTGQITGSTLDWETLRPVASRPTEATEDGGGYVEGEPVPVPQAPF